MLILIMMLLMFQSYIPSAGLNVPPVQPERLLVVEPGGRTSVWVQAVGRGLQYQWCKRAEGRMSSTHNCLVKKNKL